MTSSSPGAEADVALVGVSRHFKTRPHFAKPRGKVANDLVVRVRGSPPTS